LRQPLSLQRPFVYAVCAGLLFVVWLRLHQPPNTVDDAYITFRYARNLAAGVGFVYNPGDHVLGTTTPAWAMLLASLARLTGFTDFPRLALMTNTLLDSLTFAVLLRLVTRMTGWRWLGLGAAVLYSLEGRALDFSTGGMEASFNVLAVTTTLLLFFERRDRWAALALGLAVLVRPDGIMLAAALFAGWGLEALRRRRPWPWVQAGLFALVVAPWALFALFYFGNPIPQSILAKSELYRTPELMAFRAFLVQLRTIFPFSLPPLNDPEPLARQILQAVLPAALAALGLFAFQRRNPRAWPLALYIAGFVAFYSYGNPLWLGWYEIPLMPLYQALILTGLVFLASRLPPSPLGTSNGEGLGVGSPVSPLPAGEGPGVRARTTDRAGPGLWVSLTALLALAVMALPHLSRLNVLPWETRERPLFVLNPAFNKRREEDYTLLARMLRPAGEAGRLVAIPEIGAFGYTYPGHLFDTSGLISPPVLKYFPIPAHIPVEIYSVPREMIFDLRPDLFISFDSMLQATLPPDDPEFRALYTPTIGLTSHAAFGVQRLVAYRRADLPVEVTLPPAAHPAAVTFGDGIVTLLGYNYRPWSDQENDFLELTVYWRGGPAPAGPDLLARVDLYSASGGLVYQVIDYPGEGLFPPAAWSPGMWLVDRFQLKRPQPDQGPYTATLTLFTADSDEPLPAVEAGGARLPGESVVIDAIVLAEDDL
jgi:hypothetical protein